MSRSRTTTARAVRSILVLVALVVAGSLTVPATAAAPAPAAVPAAAAPLPTPVKADVLPAPQINGVVWKQAIAGSVAYAGGEFTEARPFGVAAGGAGAISVNNLIDYNLDTGALDTSFHPDFDGQILDMAVTPDASKLVVVGDFTHVDGQARNRVAVFNLPAQTLSTIAPSANNEVKAVAATNSTIWLGGSFSRIGSVTRSKVAAVSAATGAVTSMNITGISGGDVNALAVKPDGTQIALGGSFTSVGGSTNPGFGMYLANATTGAKLPLATNSVVRDAGANAAILSMGADSTSFYGAGYDFNAGADGNSEGVFQASWSTGKLVTLEDCHGDSYGVAPIGGIVYEAGHHHQCLNSGGFPQTAPSWTIWHSTAWTKAAEGTNTTDSYGYPDHPGTPRGALLPFFPQYQIGTYTHQNQATWTVTGNANYVIYGGEFPSVDGIAQQGIVRFGTHAESPDHVGPSTQSHVGPLGQDGGSFVAHVQSFTPGQVRVSWPALWDRDDLNLTYTLTRDGTQIYQTNLDNYQWSGKQLVYTDTGQTGGSTPSYVVTASDPDGNTLTSGAVSTTVDSTDQLDSYAATVIGDGATKFWRLDDSGSSTADLAGPDYPTAGSGVGRGVPGALMNGGSDTASSFDGSANGVIVSNNLTMAPDTFTEEVWFKTTSTSGGKLAGFGDAPAGSTSTHFDRHLYMTPGGIVKFGVAPNGQGQKVVSSPTALNDGQWHEAVGTLSSAGMKLYIDGVPAQEWATWTSGEHIGGYWRVGGDSTWSGGGANDFTGDIDDFSLYPTALTDAQIRAQYTASGRTAGAAPTAPRASIAASARGRRVAWRGTGSASGTNVAGYAWNFGDGTRSAAQNPVHIYARPGTYTATLTVTDGRGFTGTTSRRVTVANARPYATFTASVHKKTVTFNATRSSDVDGRVVTYTWKFGDKKAGHGASVRHVYKKAKKFYVKLTITDNSGAKTSVTKRIKTKKH